MEWCGQPVEGMDKMTLELAIEHCSVMIKDDEDFRASPELVAYLLPPPSPAYHIAKRLLESRLSILITDKDVI